MADIQRPRLYGKLNPLAYQALDSAANLAKIRGNPRIELLHWINQILMLPNSDLHRILAHFHVNESRLTADLVRALDSLPRGSVSQPGMSSLVDEATRQGWVYATLMFGESRIRVGHVLVGLLKSRDLAYTLLDLSIEFEKVSGDSLAEGFAAIVSGSPEETLGASDRSNLAGGAAPGETSGAVAPGTSRGEALARFTVDLTERARKGEIDPVVGRDAEIRQVVDILLRRRQNNPVLVGEAGVGKTAVVEGFAHRLVAGDVPPSLRGVVLRSLDVGLLQAGASMKGEFEQRLRSVIDEVQQSEKPIVLFVDEVHTLIGAGGQAGTGDAANLLKPALARGTLRTVAATTWDEYRKHIEKDPALSRRFQQVYVDEPDEPGAVRMLRSASGHLEKHHSVQILDEAIEAAVRLSLRYVPARQLPDKAVSLLDTAAARVGITQHATPARVEDLQRTLEALETELGILGRESAEGQDHGERLADLRARLDAGRADLKALESRWAEEKALVADLLSARARLREAGAGTEPADGSAIGPLAEAYRQVQARLAALQGEAPLLFPWVDAACVASVVAEWTGIPVGRMARRNVSEILGLADVLERRVIGQRHALEMVARRIQSSHARLGNPERPVAVFMFVGPSGTGKTETALALAEALYGGEQNLIAINMSEFQEKHTVSTLKGAPPGYVGYGEGGVLTEAVRRRPYSVVLLDEVEKAHPDVHKIFFQVFDKGHMEDSEGRAINFRNTVIILTSNAAQDVVVKLCKDPSLKPDPEALESALRIPLTKTFPDALLNRLVVVPYYPITGDILHRIVRLNLARLERRIRDHHKIPFTYDDSVVESIARRCGELDRGARLIETTLAGSMLPEISREYLTCLVEGRELLRVHVTATGDDLAYQYD